MQNYVITGLVVLIILLFLAKWYMMNRMENMVNLAETDSLCVKQSRNPRYPIYPYEKYKHQRRLFDSLTYDYYYDTDKKIIPRNVCF